MSIVKDRQAIYTALTNISEVDEQQITVYQCVPQNLTPFSIYIELSAAAQGTAFASLDMTWDIVATGSAKHSSSAATAFLDQLTDAIITALAQESAANIDDIQPYFVLTDNSNGASIPAVRISVKSRTTIKE